MPNGDTQDIVIKTDAGTFRIKAPKGMEQSKVLAMAAASSPKFAEIYPTIQAKASTDKAAAAMAPAPPTTAQAAGREGALGFFGGLGIPETKQPLTDLAKGLYRTGVESAKEFGKEALSEGPAYAAGHQIVKQVGNVAKQTGGAYKEIYKGAEKSIGGHPEEGIPEAAHGVGTIAGQATQLLAGSKLPKTETVLGGAARASAAFEELDQFAAHANVKVPAMKTLQWAVDAETLASRGRTMPPPVKAFLERMRQWQEQGIELTYDEARDFSTALGEKIDWEQYGGKGGKMNGIAKQMKKSLEADIHGALKEKSPEMAQKYSDNKHLFSKVVDFRSKVQAGTKAAGALAGYGGGKAVGHPWMGGYVGMRLGEQAGGKVSRWLTGDVASPGVKTSEAGARAAIDAPAAKAAAAAKAAVPPKSALPYWAEEGRTPPGVDPKLKSIRRKMGGDTERMAKEDEKIRKKAQDEK